MDQIMDVEMPPAQDSPEHILNVLNDDCIQSVFHQNKNVQDFLSAAETCVRFQENAKLIFRSQYKSIRIGKLHDNRRYTRETITVDRVESFLSLFGNLITEIDFDRQSTVQSVDDNIQNMIADSCGRTMVSFKLSSFNALVNFSTRSPLQALQKLGIYDTNIYNFRYHSQLRELYVSGRCITQFDWLIQPFPQLEIVTFYLLCRLENNQAIEFLKLNPQIRCLCIEYCMYITPLLFENIDALTPNLEKLSIWIGGNFSLDYFLLNISNLWMLKCLTINIPYSEMPLVRLVDRLIENDIPLEKFAIFRIRSYSQIHQLNVTELKLLKKLCLPRMSDELLIKFVKKLPALEFMSAPK